MKSSFKVEEETVILTEDLEIQCNDPLLIDLCNSIIQSAKKKYSPAYGYKLQYYLTELTTALDATEIQNGFKRVDNETEPGMTH